MKRFFAVALAVIMCMSMTVPAFAAEKIEPIASEWETIYIELDDGRVVTVEIMCNGSAIGDATTLDLTPQHPVGKKNIYPIRISNSQLSAPFAVGGTISALTKREIAQIVTTTLNGYLGAAIKVSAALALIAHLNTLAGNTGFLVNATVEYQAHYISSEGYYLYGWGLTAIDLSAY